MLGIGGLSAAQWVVRRFGPKIWSKMVSRNGLGNPEIGPARAQRPLQKVTRFAGHRLNWSSGLGGPNFRVSEPISGPNFRPNGSRIFWSERKWVYNGFLDLGVGENGFIMGFQIWGARENVFIMGFRIWGVRENGFIMGFQIFGVQENGFIMG